MPIITRFEHCLGDIVARYVAPVDSPDAVGLVLIPASRIADVVPSREALDSLAIAVLPEIFRPKRAWDVDPLVHVRVGGEPAASAFAQGRTMRGGPTTEKLRLREHTVIRETDRTIVRTVVADGNGLECVHELARLNQEPGLRCRTRVRNNGGVPLTLELVTAFSLGGITPFAPDEAACRLSLHRFRATWSAEGRPVADTLEHLGIERSWTGGSVAAERFGSTGSVPTNGWHPVAALRDDTANVTWGAQIVTPGAWQMEVYRRSDQVAFSGGCADREFGQWFKALAPGEEYASPEALLAVVSGGMDELQDVFAVMLDSARGSQPEVERDLPPIFNEFCTSWGMPTHDNALALADRLSGSGVRYLVIDDGWSERPGPGLQQNGDWRLDRKAFPHGLLAFSRAVRERGLIPGIWFEPEVVNQGCEAWLQTSHMLHRDGVPIQVGSRRFWDFRDPWVHDYLEEKVIRLLRDNEFGYIKIDYNDSIGVGCDGGDSPGLALLDHLAGVQRFFRRLREAIPGLVIENCSAGGHRLEASMLALSAMSSFSDAHETPDIPLIAANTLRLVGAPRNQVWCVLRAADSRQRLAYSLSATFLGRMCLSGEVNLLEPEAWEFVLEAIAMHRRLIGRIATARVRRHGQWSEAYQRPCGWQGVVYADPQDDWATVVWHAFADAPGEIVVPLPPGEWRIASRFDAGGAEPRLSEHGIVLASLRPWHGGVVELVATSASPRS